MLLTGTYVVEDLKQRNKVKVATWQRLPWQPKNQGHGLGNRDESTLTVLGTLLLVPKVTDLLRLLALVCINELV